MKNRRRKTPRSSSASQNGRFFSSRRRFKRPPPLRFPFSFKSLQSSSSCLCLCAGVSLSAGLSQANLKTATAFLAAAPWWWFAWSPLSVLVLALMVSLLVCVSQWELDFDGELSGRTLPSLPALSPLGNRCLFLTFFYLFFSLSRRVCLFITRPLLLTLCLTRSLSDVGKIKGFAVVTGSCRHNTRPPHPLLSPNQSTVAVWIVLGVWQHGPPPPPPSGCLLLRDAICNWASVLRWQTTWTQGWSVDLLVFTGNCGSTWVSQLRRDVNMQPAEISVV